MLVNRYYRFVGVQKLSEAFSMNKEGSTLKPIFFAGNLFKKILWSNFSNIVHSRVRLLSLQSNGIKENQKCSKILELWNELYFVKTQNNSARIGFA